MSQVADHLLPVYIAWQSHGQLGTGRKFEEHALDSACNFRIIDASQFDLREVVYDDGVKCVSRVRVRIRGVVYIQSRALVVLFQQIS
jgi:hypothetical protein